MYAISLTGGPQKPFRIGILLIIVIVVLALAGCDTRQYREVPLCIITEPPKPDQYIEATPDEQTVMFSSAYIRQVNAVRDCNLNIEAINERNKAE